MSAPEREEFAMLLSAHTNRELTGAEHERLEELVRRDPSRRDEVRAVDDVHVLFDCERVLREEVLPPAEPREEADESYRRLERSAADAQDLLRARLRHGTVRAAAVRPRRRRAFALAAAALLAAALVLVVALASSGGDRPGLLDRTPGDGVLGSVPKILLATELSATRRELSWHPVLGASRYDAVVEDEIGTVLLERPDERARSTVWQFDADEFGELRSHLRSHPGASLLLRIVARDGAGVVVASSGDLPLHLVD